MTFQKLCFIPPQYPSQAQLKESRHFDRSHYILHFSSYYILLHLILRGILGSRVKRIRVSGFQLNIKFLNFVTFNPPWHPQLPGLKESESPEPKFEL